MERGWAKWFPGLLRACHRIPLAAEWPCGSASRCYELQAQTRDVCWECFEQRDALGSITNTQMPSGTTHDSTISLSPNQASRPDIGTLEATMSEETVSSPGGYAAWAALDWGSQKHVWALQAVDCDSIEQGQIEATPEAIEVWAAGLAQRFGGRPVAVALEQARGALLYALAKYAHLVLYPVHPTSLARYREAFSPSGAKDDGPDARLLLDFLRRHPEHLRPWEPDTIETRTIQFLAEDRRMLVNEKTRQTLRLGARLLHYFPQVVEWFKELDSPMVGDLLRRWPTLEQLQKARPATLRQFFYQHNSRSHDLIEERLQIIRQALPLTQDAAVIQAGVSLVKILVEQIAALRQGIAELERQLDKLFRQHPDAALYLSLPGAGPALGPRLLAAMGTRRERYPTAAQIQCYSGIAPVLERSGQRESIHFRRACPKFLRQTFHEWAGHSIASSEWAHAYYDHQSAQGKGHHAAVRSLAFKWIRILHSCWINRTPYDEARYQEVLRHRSAARRPNVPTRFAWERTTGNFFRFAGTTS